MCVYVCMHVCMYVYLLLVCSTVQLFYHLSPRHFSDTAAYHLPFAGGEDNGDPFFFYSGFGGICGGGVFGSAVVSLLLLLLLQLLLLLFHRIPQFQVDVIFP